MGVSKIRNSQEMPKTNVGCYLPVYFSNRELVRVENEIVYFVFRACLPLPLPLSSTVTDKKIHKWVE